MSIWSIACLLMGVSMIAGGIVLVLTVYMAVIGLFFMAMGALLCVGALESSVTEEMDARAEAEKALTEPRLEPERPIEKEA